MENDDVSGEAGGPVQEVVPRGYLSSPWRGDVAKLQTRQIVVLGWARQIIEEGVTAKHLNSFGVPVVPDAMEGYGRPLPIPGFGQSNQGYILAPRGGTGLTIHESHWWRDPQDGNVVKFIIHKEGKELVKITTTVDDFPSDLFLAQIAALL